jgi:predicted DNA-binding transcriptional regulator AlpA
MASAHTDKANPADFAQWELVDGGEIERALGGVSSAGRWRLVEFGLLPKPIKLLGGNRAYWLRRDLLSLQKMLDEARRLDSDRPGEIHRLSLLPGDQYAQLRESRAAEWSCSVRALDHAVQLRRGGYVTEKKKQKEAA